MKVTKQLEFAGSSMHVESLEIEAGDWVADKDDLDRISKQLLTKQKEKVPVQKNTSGSNPKANCCNLDLSVPELQRVQGQENTTKVQAKTHRMPPSKWSYPPKRNT